MKSYVSGLSPIFFLLFSISLMAQQQITGRVVDSEGVPLYGSNIIIENTTQGTTSDQSGIFNIQNNQNLPVNLVVSYIGFKTQIIQFNGNDSITIELESGNYFD